MSTTTRRAPRAAALTAPILALALAACFVNEGVESAGNTGRQDSGLHVRLVGNFVLNVDGSRAVTTARLDHGGGALRTHLIGVAIPSLAVRVGPVVDDGLESPRIMLTPSPMHAWLVGLRSHSLSITPLDLETMRLGPPLTLPPGRFDAAILSPDGRKLAVGRVWDPQIAAPLHLLEVPLGSTPLGPAAGAIALPLSGALFDARFTRAGDRLVVLTVPVDDAGHYRRAATVTVYATDQPHRADEVARFELPDFALNLLGVLTWSIRISPDGRWAAVSGRQDDVQTTHVFDLVANRHHDALPCDGPVGFTPDSAAIVGFRDLPGAASELVISDLEAGTSEASPLTFNHPIYWIAPSGQRVVTYPFAGRGLVITDLDSLESVQSSGDDVALREFVVGPDADFVYLVHGGALFLLDIEAGAVEQLEPASRDYDNINILPDGDTLVLAGESTTRFDLWSVTTASTLATARLPTQR